MTCKMLFFDCRKNEKLFFEKNDFPNFEIKFIENSLNKKTIKNLSPEDLENTAAINVFTPSLLSAEVINEFPNLRIISTRSKSYDHIDINTCLKRNIAVINVETDDKLNENHILQSSIKSITNVLCGSKENRVV